MTLLNFFTVYVFYPLSFSLRKLGRHGAAIGLLAVFLLSALWHGFGVTFFIWGVCHAAFVLAEYYTKAERVSLRWKYARVMLVLFLFSFGNIFFRSTGLDNCGVLLSQLTDFRHFIPVSWAADFIAPLAVGGHQIDQFNFYDHDQVAPGNQIKPQ